MSDFVIFISTCQYLSFLYFCDTFFYHAAVRFALESRETWSCYEIPINLEHSWKVVIFSGVRKDLKAFNLICFLPKKMVTVVREYFV